METWFLNHVLGVSLSVLLLALPGPLGARTPGNNSTEPVTAGFYRPGATDGLSETSTSYSSESLSPSQRNILLTHTADTHTAAAAGSSDTERTQTFAETSSRSLEVISQSTEPLTSTLVEATTEASSISSSSSGSSSSSIVSSSSGSKSTNSSSKSTSSSSRSTSSSSGGSSSSDSSSTSSSKSTSSTSSISSSSDSSSTSSSKSTSSSSSSSSSISSSIGSSSSSSSSSSMSSSRAWKDSTNTDQAPEASPAVSWESRSWMLTEDTRLPQDSPDTTLRLGDASTSHTAVHPDSTYTSSTISRAGERTLLSVTSSASNSTSSAFTEDSSNSHQPPSTWGVPETEDYTRSAPSTRTDSGDTTDQHTTFKGEPQETGSPGESRGTQSLTGQPNATHYQYTSTSEETSDSTPPLRATESSTEQSEVSVSSTPPVISPSKKPTDVSGTEQGAASSVGTSTESSTGAHSSSTQNQESTEGVSSQTREETVGPGLTTGPPTVSSTSEVDDSLTDTPVHVTEVFPTTTPVTVTERSKITEEDTFKATTPSTTTTTPTTLPLPATSSSSFSRTMSSSTPESTTEATIPNTTPSTTASTLVLPTSAARPTHHVSPSQTQGPSTRIANPTNPTTLQIETSTLTPGVTTTIRRHITTTTTTSTTSTPAKTTEALQTTRKQTDRGTTELVGTTPPTTAPPPPPVPPPGNPCVSNPCMNGGMCASYQGPQFTCHCQQAWTGPTCSQDVDECEDDPCPAGSRCVNTRGSFSCECPLGFDLEDGRTCTRAKTFLGTFSVNRPPHDPAVFKSATMHEIQREIIQLLNASLSALRGYSRSTLSKKEEDGLRISAVNMFSISTDVTSTEVFNSIQMFLSNCSSSLAHCRMVLHHKLTYRVESLCVAQKTPCDTERSTCTDVSGTANCQCLQGYYKHDPDDLYCLECRDGYKFENGTCKECMFGFGGFNCGNFYKLIAVVVSPAGGALLLILIIALIVTCCKKDKNDINKIIFKSGDLQMSPYADFPKNNRISTEWGRETIEMQENGSTKNLLQMTDIYYSPALRNSDLERNGLYPFTGLPGSRHSCIYPATWNPSFISDDSRRRDYF